jgi:hypothetical protein
MVSFYDDPKPVNGQYIIGNVDTDMLVLDVSGEVIVMDYTSPTNILWNCAASSEKFLAAMVLVAQHSSRMMISEEDSDIEFQARHSPNVFSPRGRTLREFLSDAFRGRRNRSIWPSCLTKECF